MAREKSTSIYVEDPASSSSTPNGLHCTFPNDADRTFNHAALLRRCADTGLGHNADPEARIAIIGAGAAGLASARELFRCGYRKIDIYEASDRIGGRLYSVPVPNQHVTFEMGAMRMPFFSEPGSGNSMLDHYATRFGLRTQPFPNPGSAHARTGIYMHDGCGPIPDLERPPTMDIWEREDPHPPLPILRDVYDKWARFAAMVQSACKAPYNAGGEAWQRMWRAIASRYWDKDFADLVYMPRKDAWDPSAPGDFGGLGMTEQEAWIFYVIGAGDGGWGAFFHVSALYPIRTLLFGYATNHQLIQGRFDSEGGFFTPGPHHLGSTQDSLGHPLSPPGWLGVQSVAEALFYLPVRSAHVDNISLYDASQRDDYDIHLYTRTPARVVMQAAPRVYIGSDIHGRYYDAAVLTCPTWALQMSMDFVGFTPEMLPFEVRNAIKSSHWITSCKVFYPLRERYWETTPIPQLMMTDSFIQGVYGYAVDTPEISGEAGVLLVSYTWEDDATKLLSIPAEEALAARCLAELDQICMRSTGIHTRISPCVDTHHPVVIHWSRQPTYAGCSKLYRERMWNENRALLAYNQNHSARSSLYFAGDAYSLTSGWLEPALRSAVDATLHILMNAGCETHGDFDPQSDYPEIDMWSPETSG